MPQFDAISRYGRPNVAWEHDPLGQMRPNLPPDTGIVDTPLAGPAEELEPGPYIQRASSAPLNIAPHDRDLIVRTVIGEAANQPPEGQAAVAHVILNRLKSEKYGTTAKDVVLAPRQFEPWDTRRSELLSYNPQSPAYRNAEAIVNDVIAGKVPDPTTGATHFLQEEIVRGRRGGTLPPWARGEGQRIGDHTFYKPNEGRTKVAQNFTPVDNVFPQLKNFTPVEKLFPNAAKTPTPAGAPMTPGPSEVSPVESVFNRPAAPVPQELSPGSAPAKPDKWQSTEIDMENKRLAGTQFTLPYMDAHKDNFVGDAIIGDDDAVYYKGPGDEWIPTEKSKHVVLRDPADGKYKVFNRSEDTDLGPVRGRLMGLGRVVEEGLATTPLAGATPLTAAERAAKAAATIQEGTGVAVRVPKTAVTENALVRAGERTISHIPGAGGPMTRGAGEMSGGLEAATREAATIPTGVISNAEEAGAAARFGITERIKPKGIFSEMVNNLYKRVDAFATEARAPLNNTLARVQDIATKYAATEREGLPTSVKEVLGAVTHPEGITYQAMKRLRSDIGEMIDTGVNPGMSMGELKQLYGALTEDIKATLMSQGGKRAVAAWEKANTQASVIARQKEKLAKILGSSTKGDEGIFNSLYRMAGSTASADAKTLALAKRSMSPSEWNEVVSSVISRLGRTGAAKDASFDPSKFVRDYDKLSPAGKNMLFGSNARLRKSLDDISKLSQEPWAQAAEVAHAPGELGHLVGLAGIWHYFTHALGAVAGSNMAARFLSRTNTAENAASFMRSTKLLRTKPSKAQLVAYSNAARVLTKDAAQEARDELGMTADKAGELAAGLYDYVMKAGSAAMPTIPTTGIIK